MDLKSGWYPDQSDAQIERYWDEKVWTSKTRPVNVEELISGPSLFSLPAGWYPDQHNPQAERYWNGASWTAQTRRSAAEPSMTGAVPTQPQSRPDSPRIRLYKERLTFGTFFGSCFLAIIAMVLFNTFILSRFHPSELVVQLVIWLVGIPLAIALFIAQLTVAPEETNCPACGKRFRDGYDTCRQCGYTKPTK